MTIINREEDFVSNGEEFIIDLQEPEGNVFHLIGLLKKCLSELEYFEDEISEVEREMMSSDYDNALRVFDRHLGDYIVLLK